MADYFNDIYLRRINRYGRTLQQRVVNKKEHDFHHFVRKSPNRVEVFIRDYNFEGVLQTKTYDEIETIDYFLTYKSIEIPTGTILKVRDIRDIDEYTYWIVVSRDNFVSAGYNRYTVVKLDREIRWITDEGFLFKALVHISGSGSGGTNRRLISAVKITNESVVYMPNQVLTLVMQDKKEIKRGTRINIKGIVWKISGYDNVTNEGVSYVTLEQDYTDDSLDNKKHLPEDREPPYEDGIADGYKLEQWTFDSDLNEEIDEEDNHKKIYITLGESVPVNFYASYFNKKSDAEVVVKVTKGQENVAYNDRTLLGLNEGEAEITVRLKDSPDVEGVFYIEVVENGTANDFSIEGAARFKYGLPQRVTSDLKFEVTDIEVERQKKQRNSETGQWEYVPILISIFGKEKDKYYISDLFPIENAENETENWYREITLSEMTKKAVISFKAENGETTEKTIAVESPWIGG